MSLDLTPDEVDEWVNDELDNIRNRRQWAKVLAHARKDLALMERSVLGRALPNALIAQRLLVERLEGDD